MKEITLTILFEGTIYSIEEPNTHLHKILYNDCKGERIYSVDDLTKYPEASHLKMGFDGCGIKNGVGGALFGVGVIEQSQEAVAVVEALIKAGYKVKLNSLGLSRGGVAALLMAKELAHIDPYHLETNLLLLDPVSGNLKWTAYFDLFGYSLTNRIIDLTESNNLAFVETLYPYLEVGEDTNNSIDKLLAHFHVPLRPSYPKQSEIIEEVILGTHLRAFQDFEKNKNEQNLSYGSELIPLIKELSKIMMHRFLSRVGSLALSGTNDDLNKFTLDFNKDKDKWTVVLNDIIANIDPKIRALHSLDGSAITVTNDATYLNKSHRKLFEPTAVGLENLCLKVIPERPHHAKRAGPISQQLVLDLIPCISKQKDLKKYNALKRIEGALIEKDDYTEEQLSFILRDIIAVALQRDATSFYMFGGNSENNLIMALNEQRFLPIRHLIKFKEKALNIADLRAYVLGRNDATPFSKEHGDTNMNLLEHHTVGEDGFPDWLGLSRTSIIGS